MELESKRVVAGVCAIALCCGVLLAPQRGYAYGGVVASADDSWYSGECGEDATYSFDTETCTLTVSGTGTIEKSTWGSYSYTGTIETVVVGEGITSIGNSILFFLHRLTEVRLPSTLTSIGQNAFYGCDALESVTLPRGVASIGRNAFKECSSLTDVYFEGTEEEWNAIDIDGENDVLLGATVHYLGSGDQPAQGAVTGDLDGDGTTDGNDLFRLKRYLLGVGGELDASADLNGDGAVNVLDLLVLKRYLLGLTDSLD